ncbi:MAG: ComF family protein [Clostridiales bacterium]|nr:ComF family protein [Clostridiales bacterium]
MMGLNLQGAVLELLFPPACPYCGEKLEAGLLRCEDCGENLRFLDTGVCTGCGRMGMDCSCNGRKHRYDAVAAPFYYEAGPEQAVKRLKFLKKTGGVAEMALQMERSLDLHFAAWEADCVTCVPISRQREEERGFNQSELLARRLAKRRGLTYQNLLRKVVDNEPQYLIRDAQERRRNVDGVYRAARGRRVPQRVLLVDDVKTTGATLEECARVLKQAGCREVYGLCFAVASGRKAVKRDECNRPL